MAAATRAKLPGADGTTTRIVRLYEAEGVAMRAVYEPDAAAPGAL